MHKDTGFAKRRSDHPAFGVGHSFAPFVTTVSAVLALVTTAVRAPAQSVWGNALSFDGTDDYVQADAVPLANTSFTLEAWARRVSTNTMDFILGQGTGVTERGLHFGFHFGSVFVLGFYNDDLFSSTSYTDTNWHHWAATYNATNRLRCLYRDGALIASNTASADFQGSGPLLIGRVPWTGATEFHGSIDDVRIWNAARSQAEIQANMNHPLAGSESNLVAYWKFDESSGTLIAGDSTGHGHDGTLVSDPVWISSGVSVPLHFAWSPIASPQSADAAFPVTVTARDQFDNVYPNFTDAAELSGGIPRSTTNFILGPVEYNDGVQLTDFLTVGYAFTPNMNLTITHVRNYIGHKVSIWTDDGVLLAAQTVSSEPATWVETPLPAPLQLTNGVRYRVGVYVTNSYYLCRNDMAGVSPYGTIDASYMGLGDSCPTNSDPFGARWWLVDLRYTAAGCVPVPVSPTNSLNFTNGTWSGDMTVLQPATNMVLIATDSAGHRGISDLFDVGPSLVSKLDHFAWSPIASPQSAEAAFPVTVTARDQFDNVYTNFTDVAELSGGIPWSTTNFILGPVVHNDVVQLTDFLTVGYAFTPNMNLTITHVRNYIGHKVSIWTDDGVLLAAQTVSSEPATWVETPLPAPLQLTNGVRYRVGVYVTNYYYLCRNDMAGVSPYGTIDASYMGLGDSCPTNSDPFGVRWWLVDLRYAAAGYAPVPVSPTNSLNFTNGTWSGDMTVLQPATNMVLMAAADAGHHGISNPFDVGPSLVSKLDHFAWSPIASPQNAEAPFPVTVTARDQFDNAYTNFTDTVALSGGIGWSTTNFILGPVEYTYAGDPDVGTNLTVGYAFTPNANLTVTHLRNYIGHKVSIWTDDGVLLAAQTVSSAPGTWVETPLPAPLQLTNGVRYRVGVYVTNSIYACRDDMAGVFPYGTIDGSYIGLGDSCPTNSDPFGVRWWLVDLRYTAAGYAPVPVSPTNSLNFTNGTWSGDMTVLQPATNMVLIATDSAGHRGISDLFDVRFRPPAPVFTGCAVATLGHFRLLATGTAGLTYTLQISTNLADWVDRTNLVADPDGLLECLEEMKTNVPSCFYRLLWRWHVEN